MIGFEIPESPDARPVTPHEADSVLAAASAPPDDAAQDQTAHRQETGRDSYRMPLYLIADRAELRGLFGVSLIGTASAPQTKTPLGTAPDGPINSPGRAGAAEKPACTQSREEGNSYSRRWTLTVGAMVQAAITWVAIHFSISARAKSRPVPSITEER